MRDVQSDMETNALVCKFIGMQIHRLVRMTPPPVESIIVMMIVWRLEGKIIRTVLCCIVYDSCAH